MADGIFTFTPRFNEFLPVYKSVSRVWIGNGSSTGTSGMLYVEYQDGLTEELGSVSLYATAVENGYTGTEAQWVKMIIGVAHLIMGSKVEIFYQVSESGTEHPPEDPVENWSSTPVFEKGKFTWAQLKLEWLDGNTTIIYFSAYQGQDGQVESVNGMQGQVELHGENLHIGEDNEQSIKDYIDEHDILNYATDEDIDELFSMVFFTGAAFITGRGFVDGDSITYQIEPITPNAPMPQFDTTTIYPRGGTSHRFKFGYIAYTLNDLPYGETTATFEYKVTEKEHHMAGVSSEPTVHYVSVKIEDNGNGTLKIEKSENFNSMYFVYTYTALGFITFDGGIQLNGRSMAAREFMVRIMEGNEIVADNISTTVTAASGELSAIAFPPINYTLDDIGYHTYTVMETSPSGDGVTISDTVYTVNVEVRDHIIDGHLEIITDGSEHNIDFINTYEASGSVTFGGIETLVHRLYREGDSLSIGVTGSGQLPSPAIVELDYTVGEAVGSFVFPTINYTLFDMLNPSGGYDDTKTIVYTVREVSTISGVTFDGRIHTVTVRITDNKKGSLLTDVIYNDGNQVEFIGTYDAHGSIIFVGEKRLVNRKFIATDEMYATITSQNGKLPYINSIRVPLATGTYLTDFNFIEVTYDLADLDGSPSRIFNYVVTEQTIIPGSSQDSLAHTCDVYVADNYDGTLTVTPTYSDGNKFSFTSTYYATGFVGLMGIKNIQNRTFKDGDTMSITVTSDDGKLPNPATISVPLTTGANTAGFNFSQITYDILDLELQDTMTFHYVLTETVNMPGTAPISAYDTVSVTITDNYDGSLNVVPAYAQGDRASLTNVYSAYGDLDFKVKCEFINGNMNNNPFTIRITQVEGNNSDVQATENVVLPSPRTQIVEAGASQNIEFNSIVQFVRNSVKDDTQATYWFMIDEILPQVDSEGIYNNVKYDRHRKWINVSVADRFDGTLAITKSPAPDTTTGLDDTFTNEQLANLTINKLWTGDYDGLTTAEKNPFIFTVTGPDQYSESFTYADMVNDSKTFEHLKLGEYIIAESNTTVENFTITTSYSVGGSSTNRVELVRGGSSINVIDNVNRLEGTLNIVKVWAGDHQYLTEAQKEAVTFTVIGPKQKSTDASTYRYVFTYADMANGTMTINRLTLGTYSVVESSFEVPYFDVSVAYTVDGSVASSVEIGDGDNETITVTDTYDRHVGSVKVTKTFVGITPYQEPENFNITNDYNNSVFTYANADNAATADGVTVPYEWTITNVPVRTHIRFAEHNAEIQDYDLEASAVPNDYTSSAVVRYETSSVHITDSYIIHKGSVKVTKLFTDITSAQKPENFNITNNYNASVFNYDNAINRAIADGITTPYEWIINNVPVHTQITFTEHNADITDYDLAASAIPADYTNVEVVKDSTSVVAITDAYTLHRGTAKVTKRFSGLTVAQKPANFIITNNYNDSVFSYANADNAGSADGITTPYEWTITGLPVHTTVQFTEHYADVHNYTLEFTSTPANRTCAAIEKNQTSTVEFYNSYTLDVGTVKVTKQFSGITSALKPENFNITNNYNDTVFTYLNADNTGVADGITIPYEWTITNVPAETTIQFTENNATVADYTLTAVTVPANRTCTPVVKDQTTTVAFTNSYVHNTGYVKVTKQFSGITAAEKPANFSITNNYNDAVFTYANASNASTADGITVPYEWILNNVFVNTAVTFTETNLTISGYDLSPDTVTIKTSANVVKDSMTTVNFLNTYIQQTGTVVVTKEFSGISASLIPEDFNITNDYDSSVFTYANADNAAEADGFNIPYEWSIQNVPVDTVIQFTENDYSVDDYQLDAGVETVISSSPVVQDESQEVNFLNTYIAAGE